MDSDFDLETWLDKSSLQAAEAELKPLLSRALECYQDYLADPAGSDALHLVGDPVEKLTRLMKENGMTGAGMLAETLRDFLAALIAGRLPMDQKALAGLGSGLLSLQRYLGFVLDKGRDIAALAVEDANVVRRAAGMILLREHAVYPKFSGEFCHSSGMRILSEESDAASCKDNAMRMAALYQRGLLALLKDQPTHQSYASMTLAARGMAQKTPPGPDQRGWLLVEMVVSCFANNGLVLNFARKRVLSDVERLFQTLGLHGPEPGNGLPREVERELCFLLALSGWRDGVVGRFIKAARIQRARPSDNEMVTLAEQLGGPDAETLIKVSAEVQVELEDCEYSLEVVAGRQSVSPEEARQLCTQVKGCANVLQMVNFNSLANRLLQAAEQLDSLSCVESSEQIEVRAMAAAENMILVRRKLDSLTRPVDEAVGAMLGSRDPFVVDAYQQAVSELEQGVVANLALRGNADAAAQDLVNDEDGFNDSPPPEPDTDSLKKLAAVADAIRLPVLSDALRLLQDALPEGGQSDPRFLSLLSECCDYLRECREQGDVNDAKLQEAVANLN